MLRSRYLIPLCVLLSIKFSTSTKLYSSTEARSLSKQETDNLLLVLNFIRQSPEFQPLTFSVILPEFQSSFDDLFLRYVTQNSIQVYKVRARDLSLKATWMDQLRLTWIFVVHDLSSLNIFIYWQWNLWKSSNQYVIIFTGNGTALLWRKVLTNLWTKYNVYRAVILPMDHNFRCLISYVPFEKFKGGYGTVRELCMQPSNEYGSLQGWNSGDELPNYLARMPQLDRGSRLFENFQDLNHYPLDVIVFESLLMNVSYDDQHRLRLDKPDANVMFALEKAMRAKFRIKAMRKVDFTEDPFGSSLQSIESGKVDMVITGFFVKTYSRYQKYQFTCAMYEDRLCFVSPDSGLVPKAYMPFLPFQKSLWAVLIVYNVLITLLWCLVKYASESFRRPYSTDPRLEIRPLYKRPRTKNFLSSRAANYPPRVKPRCSEQWSREEPPEIPRCFSTFFTFIEYLCYPFQSSETPAQRSLLFGTLFFALIVNGLYQSFLVSSLSKPIHYPQLHTLEDVLESGKVVITKYANLKNVFLDESQLDMKLIQRIRVISTRRSTKDIVAYEGRIAITRYYTMELEDFDYYDKEGNPLLYLVDECPMNYRVSYVSRLHSPYAERMDFILLRLREAGLLNFWFENMLYLNRVGKVRKKLDSEESRNTKLSLDNYILTFLFLFIGLFGSTLMFFAEVYIARRNLRKR